MTLQYIMYALVCVFLVSSAKRFFARSTGHYQPLAWRLQICICKKKKKIWRKRILWVTRIYSWADRYDAAIEERRRTTISNDSIQQPVGVWCCNGCRMTGVNFIFISASGWLHFNFTHHHHQYSVSFLQHEQGEISGRCGCNESIVDGRLVVKG